MSNIQDCTGIQSRRQSGISDNSEAVSATFCKIGANEIPTLLDEGNAMQQIKMLPEIGTA
jgi:hypothetical protein